MGSVEKLKEEYSQTLDFFNELAPQMVKAKEIVSRWSVHHYHAPWLNVAVGYFVLL